MSGPGRPACQANHSHVRDSADLHAEPVVSSRSAVTAQALQDRPVDEVKNDGLLFTYSISGENARGSGILKSDN